MGLKGRRKQKPNPIRVVWSNKSGWSYVHYVGKIDTKMLAPVESPSADRAVMVFTTMTLCGVEVPQLSSPRYGSYIEGRGRNLCRTCAEKYDKIPGTYSHVLGQDQ